MQKLTHEQLVHRQSQQGVLPRIPFCAVLNNIRSLYNVGSIFRTADGAGLEKLYLCGITGIPPDTKISKTALGAERTVPWEYQRDPVVCLRDLRRRGYQIVLLEQAQQSIAYDIFEPQSPVCLVVGNEIAGVEDGLLAHSDACIDIEMTGLKNSLNVTVAFGIVAYHFRKKLKKIGSGTVSQTAELRQ
jgi:tRNA G18 (ribose-2'-O)-methylase SpoU